MSTLSQSQFPLSITEGTVSVKVVIEKCLHLELVSEKGETKSFPCGFTKIAEQKKELVKIVAEQNRDKQNSFVCGYFNLTTKKKFFLDRIKKPFHIVEETVLVPIIYLFYNKKKGGLKIVTTEQVKKIAGANGYHWYGDYHLVRIKDSRIVGAWILPADAVKSFPHTVQITCD